MIYCFEGAGIKRSMHSVCAPVSLKWSCCTQPAQTRENVFRGFQLIFSFKGKGASVPL